MKHALWAVMLVSLPILAETKLTQSKHMETEEVLFLKASDLDSGEDLIGKQIRIEVEIQIERSTPLAKVISSENLIHQHVHLVSLVTTPGSLKKGHRYFIEGIVVDGPCYAAYTVYFRGFYEPNMEAEQKAQPDPNSEQVGADQPVTVSNSKSEDDLSPEPESEVRPQ